MVLHLVCINYFTLKSNIFCLIYLCLNIVVIMSRIWGKFWRGLVEVIRGKRCEASTNILVIFSWFLRLWDLVSLDVFLFIGNLFIFTVVLVEILPLTVYLLRFLVLLRQSLLRMMNYLVNIFPLLLATWKPIVLLRCAVIEVKVLVKTIDWWDCTWCLLIKLMILRYHLIMMLIELELLALNF